MSFVGGKLKLKGSDPLRGGVKKKKRKGAPEALALVPAAEGDDPAAAAAAVAAAGGSGGATGDDDAEERRKLREGAPVAAQGEGADRRTEAERRYEERLREVEYKAMSKQAAKSHRERIKDFNEYLSKLSEHHDLFKISGGARKG